MSGGGFVYRDNSGPVSTNSWSMTASASAKINESRWLYHPVTFSSSASHLCPDLLDHTRIGAAFSLRGRVVRCFFWLMRSWPVRP